jgi:nucleoside diphosphate kinase
MYALLHFPFILQTIIQTIKDHKFVLVQSKKLRLTRNDAEAFYAEHKGRIL